MVSFWDRREKPLVCFVFCLPFIWMFVSLLQGQYFPDPGKILMELTGIWACVSMVLVLFMSPLTKYAKIKVISRYRRFIGLGAFLYTLLHLLTYLVLFSGLSWTWIASDFIEKPYIYAGVGAFLILLVLAITSHKKMIKKLGKRWKPLHRLVYLAVLLILLHLWWQIKSDTSILVWFSAFIIPLLLIRIPQTQTVRKYFSKKN
ncbi:Ferric reductase domain protein protein transmembrane component domain protein [Marinomonas posidonica IVIA-Po-181]|uniref:Protein-methionine-sulfoxide reductase heme-binding subunit MsrQ n=2 Tax=Marinomonas TaxID=28253 RepID=F6CXI8_MARPP|nr:Ferric reductase domain protein protein transmembrane component domain protein [Marinomonas posidonica IVIA-Po-181]